MAAVALVATVGPARAQTPEPTAPAAVRYARNAFEYRDFPKVVEVLWPWLHPPRIVDPELVIQARELLGVSLHLVGRTEDAEDEFSALLLLSPDHALDPFVVPPDVIQVFEAIKEQMAPTLNALRDREPIRPIDREEQPRVELRLVEVPHWSVSLLPLGIAQFTLDKPGWGAALLAVQATGLALNAASFVRANGLSPDSNAFDQWVAAQYVGLGIAVVGYVAGVVQANNAIRARREALLTEPPPPESADR
jgi:hypothetical protein